MIWFINYKDTTIKTVDIMTPPGRFASGILGTTEAHDRVDLDRGYYYSEKVPDHFGYPNRRSLGEWFARDRYMAITKFDRMLYTTVWKAIGRFNDSDFKRLEHDPTVDKLYSNSELNVYFIHGIRTTQ